MPRHPFEPRFIDMAKLGLTEPDVIRQMRESVEKFERPYRDHLRMIENITGPYMRARELFEEPPAMKALRQQAVVRDEVLKAMAPYRQHQATMEELLKSFRPKTSIFEDVMKVALQPSAATALFADAERILQSFRIDRATATGVTIDGEDISFTEAEQELKEAWSATEDLPPAQRIQAARARLEQARKQPPLLLLLLAYILGAMFESPIQTISDPVLIPRAKLIRNWLQKNLPSIWLPTPDRRTVIGASLDLRLTHRRNSTKVGTLYEGDEVEVLDKKKDWTLVVSVDDENVGGWVFTRYLDKNPGSE